MCESVKQICMTVRKQYSVPRSMSNDRQWNGPTVHLPHQRLKLAKGAQHQGE
jgi:hypothetical protein